MNLCARSSPRRRRFVPLVLMAAMLVSCVAADEAFSPRLPRIGSPSRSISSVPSCYVNDTARVHSGYVGYLDPVALNVCGVPITLAAGNTSDNYLVFWYGPLLLASPVSRDSSFLMSGGYGFGGTLATGTGDVPLTIDFGSEVRDVQILWQMNPLPGSKVVLFDANGTRIDSAIYGSNLQLSLPLRTSTTAEYDTGTMHEVHTFAVGGVRKVVITAAAGTSLRTNSKMWIQTWFERDTTCPPTGDSTLDNSGVRQVMFDMLDSVLKDPNRIEQAMEIYRWDSGGSSYLQVRRSPSSVNGVNATECSAPIAAFIQPYYTLVGTAHAHGMVPPDTFSTCPDYKPGTKVAKGPSGCDPGRAACDFRVADITGVPVYVIDKSELFRILPNATNRSTGDFDRRWATNRTRRCFL